MTFFTFYPHGPVKYVIALAYVQSSIRTAVEGWHYSVDFVLPAVLCWYMYRDLDWVYSAKDVLPKRSKSDCADPLNKKALVAIGAGMAVVVINAFFVGA